MNEPKTWDISWAANSATSAAAFVGADSMTGIDLPAAMTGTTLTFEFSPTGGAADTNWKPAYDKAAAALSVTLPALSSPGARIVVFPDGLRGHGWVRLRSSATELAARSATLLGYR